MHYAYLSVTKVPASGKRFTLCPCSSPLPHTQPCLAPAAHKLSAWAHPLRNTPGKLRYGLFLRLPDIFGTLPYSLLTAGKISARLFLFEYIHLCSCVCTHRCTSAETATHPLAEQDFTVMHYKQLGVAT